MTCTSQKNLQHPQRKLWTRLHGILKRRAHTSEITADLPSLLPLRLIKIRKLGTLLSERQSTSSWVLKLRAAYWCRNLQRIREKPICDYLTELDLGEISWGIKGQRYLTLHLKWLGKNDCSPIWKKKYEIKIRISSFSLQLPRWVLLCLVIFSESDPEILKKRLFKPLFKMLYISIS